MVARRRIVEEDVGAVPDKSRRQCAATRVERPLDDLIRFVAAPDGRLVPDLARKLPGRGVWITGDRQSLAQAIKRGAFARSLKRPVDVPAQLTGEVESLLQSRALSLLSLANKAGEVICGFDKITRLLDAGEARALIHASDAASDGCEKLDRRFRAMLRERSGEEFSQPLIVTDFDIDQLSLAMGRSNVVHAASMKGGAASRFLGAAARLARFRNGIDAAVPAGGAA